MKRILSMLVAVVMVLGIGMSGMAATATTTQLGEVTTSALDNYDGDRLEIYANTKYTLTLGTSGDKFDIVSATTSSGTINGKDIKVQDSKADAPAQITFTAENVYGTGKTNATLIVKYKDLSIDKTVRRLTVRLDIYPQEVDAGDWEQIENGVVYSFGSEDEVDFDFDYGTYHARISGNQKDVNLSYERAITQELVDKYPSLVDVISFKGAHQFNLSGTLEFNEFFNKTDKLFVYELTPDGPVAVPYDAKLKAYAVRTRKLGTYMITDKELVIEDVEEPTTPAETPATPVEDQTPPNVNDNPGTGR